MGLQLGFLPVENRTSRNETTREFVCKVNIEERSARCCLATSGGFSGGTNGRASVLIQKLGGLLKSEIIRDAMIIRFD